MRFRETHILLLKGLQAVRRCSNINSMKTDTHDYDGSSGTMGYCFTTAESRQPVYWLTSITHSAVVVVMLRTSWKKRPTLFLKAQLPRLVKNVVTLFSLCLQPTQDPRGRYVLKVLNGIGLNA